jgi:DnaJ-class molecular chaperone
LIKYYIIFRKYIFIGGGYMKLQTMTCSYCEGAGYIDLVLGGSETCYACNGTGQAKKSAKDKTQYNKNS